jgi:hypothetical protein
MKWRPDPTDPRVSPDRPVALLRNVLPTRYKVYIGLGAGAAPIRNFEPVVVPGLKETDGAKLVISREAWRVFIRTARGNANPAGERVTLFPLDRSEIRQPTSTGREGLRLRTPGQFRSRGW